MSFQVEFPGQPAARRRRTWLDRAVAALVDERRWHEVAAWAVIGATAGYVLVYLGAALWRGCTR